MYYISYSFNSIMKLSIKDLSSILIIIAGVSTYLTIFFFTYIEKIEHKHLEKEVNYIIKNLLSDISYFIPDNKKKEIIKNLQQIKVPDLSSEYKRIEKNNKTLLYNAFTVVLTFLISTLLITYILSKKYNFNYSHILFKSFLCIIVVAIFKFIFITFFSTKYIAADLNYIKYKIIEKVEELEKLENKK